jgi:hypothetical protein
VANRHNILAQHFVDKLQEGRVNKKVGENLESDAWCFFQTQ